MKVFRSIGLVLLFIGTLAFMFSGTLLSFNFNTKEIERYTFQYINEERASRGLPVLGVDNSLKDVAKGWADNMAQRGVLEHGDFEDRLRTINYAGVYCCGEIIENYSSSVFVSVDLELYLNSNSAIARELVKGWLDSPPHREVMLMAESGDMGVAVSRKGLVSFYGVVDFKFN